MLKCAHTSCIGECSGVIFFGKLAFGLKIVENEKYQSDLTAMVLSEFPTFFDSNEDGKLLGKTNFRKNSTFG